MTRGVRILLVDDFEPWRNLVASLLSYCSLKDADAFAILRHLLATWCLGRNGYLLILRFTPRGFHRLRLETTRSSSISSRIV